MDPVRRFELTNLVVFLGALAHAVAFWPRREVAVLFVVGAALAFVAEWLVVRADLLEHRMGPAIEGVPVPVVLAWPALVYVLYRLALLVAPGGVQAAAFAGLLGVALTVGTDPSGVAAGVWRYPEHEASSPRYRDVPWWNFVGWFVVVFLTAILPVWVGA